MAIKKELIDELIASSGGIVCSSQTSLTGGVKSFV
jgi:hypothetical protein